MQRLTGSTYHISKVDEDLRNLEKEQKATVQGLHKYMSEKNDIQITVLFEYQKNKASTYYPRKLICNRSRINI